MLEWFSYSPWLPPTLLILSILLYDLLITPKLARKGIPLVGSPSRFMLRGLLNLNFAFRGVRLLSEGFRKFRDREFQIVRNDGAVIVLPPHLLEELSALPATIASPNGALEHDLLGAYTGINLILESRLHHSIVQRKLTPRLHLLIPDLEVELVSAIQDVFPSCESWTVIEPYHLLAKISARLAARALVGPALCHNQRWLGISVDYTENLFQTIVVLRFFPSWMQPFVSRLLPSYWRGKACMRDAKGLLTPYVDALITRNDRGEWTPDNEKKEDANVLAWLVDAAKGRDRDADTLAHVEVLLSLASVHTTLLRMVNVLYDLTAHSKYFSLLQQEIVEESRHGWTSASYSKLSRLDSVLRESQRMSPPTILGMKRLFKKAYTFSNGLYIPSGTYVCMPTYAVEMDATADPEVFDGLRNHRKRELDGSDEHQFSSPDPTVLNFGYGKSACPGRVFASLILKMLFVKLISEYEFKFLPGTTRPNNIVLHEFLFPWPWDKILIQRKSDSCPF